MTVELTLTRLAGSEDSARLLVVGPSLGTSVALLWRDCAAALSGFEVIGWDLPGHGSGKPATEPFTVPDIADELTKRIEALAGGRSVAYAGVSFGGAVGFELATRGGSPFEVVVCIGAAPRIGEPAMWRERAALVRRAGTPVMVEGSAQRWFAPGFVERAPRVAGTLLRALADTDKESYALACEALGFYQPGEAVKPVRVLVGEHDVVVSPETADRVLVGCGHLPPAEDPAGVAAVLIEEMRCPTTTA
ncbi:alpha/beta fold hydrolase [Lentzea nigeriaca]|uniref:alpha/beta fold hydrolase n=1 Tax=Lentzea nigeriaca TaxID=1128665 RepID=UPI00195A94BD|nr:alpha/beta fold hydrolase [Lentzea nigeriaca]MBM7864879.1 pimeloyl-ACP methyl ester carboxylesterase [Lentzea nigeriaca]